MSNAGLAYITPEIVTWARKRAGLSVPELAGKLKIPQQTVYDWEASNSHPAFGLAERLADALHIPFGYLFVSLMYGSKG